MQSPGGYFVERLANQLPLVDQCGLADAGALVLSGKHCRARLHHYIPLLGWEDLLSCKRLVVPSVFVLMEPILLPSTC